MIFSLFLQDLKIILTHFKKKKKKKIIPITNF